mmetsp:Transcript_6541/g.15723  ORF Transcript_6541/g.15723 Transcript_6541/m.15723 type:complete len:244 (+) Transcript_6541:1986-2717(+)
MPSATRGTFLPSFGLWISGRRRQSLRRCRRSRRKSRRPRLSSAPRNPTALFSTASTARLGWRPARTPGPSRQGASPGARIAPRSPSRSGRDPASTSSSSGPRTRPGTSTRQGLHTSGSLTESARPQSSAQRRTHHSGEKAQKGGGIPLAAGHSSSLRLRPAAQLKGARHILRRTQQVGRVGRSTSCFCPSLACGALLSPAPTGQTRPLRTRRRPARPTAPLPRAARGRPAEAPSSPRPCGCCR